MENLREEKIKDEYWEELHEEYEKYLEEMKPFDFTEEELDEMFEIWRERWLI
jgi:deoxyadenosine/deoxycytidine kinase